ncbi:Phosphotransferase enzyme family protein [Streptoalloteichus tenebrarius]|uniref:Phosphotransferase enzyme family protein n=1 Tax=Streptoalloteichus tenebrarius (strain ATCC 17920 / DSM 40477 / JCM 4838 / CBS 697.72 / NBRC 16177 / NCIMB 11028 / NRRL B-12390 / A12253. 1 / ISP 5477) TaxID=1933 RepID=A0ABT1I4J4_STRSD|nr:aminoglycoside phosphotransferase family protein [Streptoalloteichus tenebrarius]MCP2262490.1 Phosphotransferase enzyme family protein [Streptoalloteichus tenebrarius]BFF01541.1 aminoglycoside phosphotransferase family protein [Streptoalloteichus tenebrarius]
MRPEVAAAVGVARDHGLRATNPIVLRDGANVLVHLRPHPVVARVPARTALVRPDGGRAWLRREAQLVTHLAGRQAVPPTDLLPAGPHERDGRHVVFVSHVDHDPSSTVDPEGLGRSLRRLHEALADHPGALPELGLVHESLGFLDRADDDVPASDLAGLRATHAEIVGRLDALAPPFQALHGDAHAGNVLSTKDGLLWADFEDACRGPVQWDLACLVATALVRGDGEQGLTRADVPRVVRAYGLDPNDAVLALMVRARVFVMAAWCLATGHGRPAALALAATATRWLLDQRSGRTN